MRKVNIPGSGRHIQFQKCVQLKRRTSGLDSVLLQFRIKCGGALKEEENEKGKQRQDLDHCSLAPRDLFEVDPKRLEVDAEFLQKEAQKKP